MVKMTKSVANGMLADVAEEKRFWCVDGRYLKNLEELEASDKECNSQKQQECLA